MYWEPDVGLVINLPGFSALTGFKALFYGDRQSALNPGTTVLNQKNDLVVAHIPDGALMSMTTIRALMFDLLTLPPIPSRMSASSPLIRPTLSRF